MNRSIISLLSLILLFGAGCDKGNEVIDDKDIKFDTLDVNYGDLGELETGEVCQSGCLEEWKKECSGSGYHVCQDEDDDGCFEWSAVIKCEPGKVCKEGECVPACADQECTAVGAHKCGENNVVLECGDYDGDGCLEWGNPVKCDEKLVCSQGYCSVSCKSECTFIGAKKCEGNDVVTCGDYNTDGCLEWGDAQDCGNLVCTNGFCKSTCEDECTVVESQKCEGNGYKICNDYNSDGCLEWGTVKNCGQNQTCSNGFCKDQCESECTAIGGKKCELNAVVVCNDYNGDGCLEWGTPLQCDEKLVCNEGYCESQCTSECTIMMAKKCDEGGNVVMCGEYDGDECLEWGSPVPCSDPYVCSEGNCSLECKDECSVKNEKKCVIGVTKSYQICDDYNKDGCLEWGTAIECEGELVCSDGNCALSCQSECAVANTKKCSGNAYQICGDYNGDTCLEWGTEVYCKVYESCDNGTCKQKQPPAEIVISEVLYDSAGSDANTFVELHGPPSTNLAGYSLVGINGNGGSEYNVIELSGTTGSDGLFLVASPTSESWIKDQADLIDAKTDYENGPDNIQLRYGSIVVDAVGYGVFSDADVFKGEGNPAPDVNYDHSIGRDENYTDTNNNANDFSDYATPSPGAANIKINEAPVAKIVCPVSGNTGENLEFDGSQSYDNDGTIVNYEFDFGDNSQKVSGGNSKVSHSFAAAGSYNVSLVVKDDLGATDSDGCAIVIGDLNKPDVTLIKPIDNKQVTQGESVQVLADATASPGRTIAKVELLADGVLYGSADTTAPYEFTYIVPSDAPTGSTITLQAKATDNLNSAGLSVPKNLKVKNDPPVASFTAVVSGALKVALDATSSSDTETPKDQLQIRWDFDNDNVWDTGWSTTKVIEHTYPAEGSYTIKLGVKDGIGQTSNATKDVTLSLVQYVSGNITTTTWTGTIVITGDTVVPSGNTLTISDGTSVLFTSIDANSDGVGDYDLTINGTLKIAGTAGNPVIFTVYGASNKNPRAWNRIILNGTGSEIKNAIIEYGDIGLEIKDNASISDTTVRFNQYCLNVLTGASATLNKVTLTDSVKDCVSVSAGTINITESAIKDNGGNGIYVNGGTMNLSLSSVTGNDKSGIEYYKGGAGLVTKNKVMGNAFEGVRIGTDGTNDPNPVINYNNVYGNALQKGRVVEDVNISASTTASDYLTKTSSSWQTPSGEILDYIYANYSEYDYDYYNYENGYVRKDSSSGAEVFSAATTKAQWEYMITDNASKIVAQVADYSSSYYASMTVVSAVYPKEGAAREVSVITASKTIDLKHNYFGVFPKALDVITLGSSNAADIQGFTGVPFDSNWTKGPYYGGEYLAGDTTWLTDIFITGDLTITSGKTLTISEGVNVLFANVDQNKDGTGDYGIFVSGGGLVVNGTSGNPVTFTVYGATKSPKSWDVVEIAGGGASSNVANAIFEYGNAGLRLQSGTHQLNAVTSRYQSSHGFQFISGTSLAADKLTASENGGDGIYLSNFSNATIDHSTITKNGVNGVSFYNSTTNLKLKNSTITYNAASGLLQQKSGVSVDHCNINYNGTGVKYAGNSTGSLGYCNVKYNNNEGIFLQTLDSYSPSPAINNNNVYGNSVIEGGKFADPGVSVSTTGSDYMTKASSPYTTPANQKIHYFQANYSEYDYDYYNYENGNVRKDSTTGKELFSATTSIGPKFVDVAAENAKTILATVADYSSSYYATMSVPLVFYYVTDLKKELSAVTDAGTVNCKTNYWGAFPDVMPLFSLGRSDAIDFQGFVGVEISGTGPQ